jgi:two-component system sensor histidine kinase UhpB
MSLRARVLVWIALVLCVGIGVGGAQGGRHAERSVRVELQGALIGGQNQVRRTLRAGADGVEDMRALLSAFDGARHIQATLTDRDGRVLAVSTPSPTARRAPPWFEARLEPRLPPVEIASGAYRFRLTAVARNEISEVWTQFRDGMVVLAVFCLGIGLAVHLALGRALRPLGSLAAGLAKVSAGDYAARLPETGPPELAGLAADFNRMAGAIEEGAATNARLQDRLLRVQDEERTDLARDLHDEIGSHLFAMKIEAGMAKAMARGEPMRERLGRIEASIAHIQANVQGLLGRLRPAPVEGLGLVAACEELAAFWRARAPAVAIDLSIGIGDGTLDPARKLAIYRLVQEGLANAVRHSRCRRIGIEIAQGPDGGVRAEVVDDGEGRARRDQRAPGLGLVGMGERVRSSGGLLLAGPAPGGGWSVRAAWPANGKAEAA